MAILAIAGVALSWAVADDKEIAKDITERLKQEQEAGNLQGFDIQLKVAEGKVLLKGHVSTPEQRKLALGIASQADGVEDVVNDLEVQGNEPAQESKDEPTPAVAVAQPESAAPAKSTTKDTEIARQIASELRVQKERGSLKRFNIDLSVDDAVVVYEGRVSSAEQLALALNIARNADGVRDVVNHLVIVRPEPELVAEKASEAEESPSTEQEVQNRLVNATTDLSQAPTAARTAEFAPSPNEAIGQASNAVYHPEAQQAFVPERVAKDQRIGQELIQKLQQAKSDGGLRGFGIGVHVSDAVVSLKGRVTSTEQQKIALEIARHIQGVRLVVNELTIVGSPAPESVAKEPIDREPEEIVQDISERLQAEDSKGNLQGCDFDVKVSDGEVWLSGKVATKEQEELALETARSVPGVKEARSALDVSAPRINLATVPVSTRAIVDTSPAITAVGVQQPAIGSPTRLAMSPNASMPVRTASAANLPAMAPSAGFVPYPTSQPVVPQFATANQTPRPLGLAQLASYPAAALAAPFVAIGQAAGGMPAHLPGPGHSVVPARYDHPNMPGYAWPSYSAHPNYAGVTYPKQYSPTAWPYIGPFYPYPQVPLGWRRVELKWDDGWWQMNFKAK